MASESARVYDPEIQQLAKMAKQWDKINALFSEYLEQVKAVKDLAVASGETHEAIGRLYDAACEYQRYCGGLGADAAAQAKRFLAEIDRIDLNLYNKV